MLRGLIGGWQQQKLIKGVCIMSLEKFFENRGINIPQLDPQKWVEENCKLCMELDMELPVSANFYHEYGTKRDWYESGSGATRVIINHDTKTALVFDLTQEQEHQEKLQQECIQCLKEAGYEVKDPATAYSWPVAGQVGNFPIGSFDSLWKDAVLIACLPFG